MNVPKTELEFRDFPHICRICLYKGDTKPFPHVLKIFLSSLVNVSVSIIYELL